MQYFGGKSRIANDIAKFLNKELEGGKNFVDLFCGSCNVISKIETTGLKYANDKHPYLIEMFKALHRGWTPPQNLSKEEYYYVKNNMDEDKALAGFVGFACSFAGKWWGGYAFDINEGKNYAGIGYRSCLKKKSLLEDVVFFNADYKYFKLPQNSVVYCDIPYKESTPYCKSILGEFNHDDFYNWVKEKTLLGHKIFVSEYLKNVPEGFKVVWKKDSIKKIRDKDNIAQETTEVIFTYEV